MGLLRIVLSQCFVFLHHMKRFKYWADCEKRLSEIIFRPIKKENNIDGADELLCMQPIFKPKKVFFLKSKEKVTALFEKMTSGWSSIASLLQGLTLPAAPGITARSRTAPANTFQALPKRPAYCYTCQHQAERESSQYWSSHHQEASLCWNRFQQHLKDISSGAFHCSIQDSPRGGKLERKIQAQRTIFSFAEGNDLE